MFQFLSGFLLNPIMAIGASAVATPILIHILSKRRYRRIRWGAMAFLLEAQQRNRRRVRLEQLLLLLLRCLAVFLIALVMMRPFIRPGALSAILGAAPRTERIFLLDDSYSMAYHAASGDAKKGDSNFTRGKHAIEQIARWIADESPADPLTLILTSQSRQRALTTTGLSDQDLRQLRDHLNTIKPSQTVARMGNAISELANNIAESPAQANTTIYIISDFQKKDWILPDDPAGQSTRSVVSPLGELVSDDESPKLVLVNVGDTSAENVALTRLVSAQPQSVAGVPARFEATLTNHSTRAMKNIELTIAIAEHRLPPVVVPMIRPGQQVREPIEITFPQEGSDYLQVSLAGAALNDDVLRLDNTRAVAVEVVPSVRVLIVDGEAGNDPYRDEVYLLRTALRPEGRAASGNELTIVDEQELEDIETDTYHALILANVGRLGSAALRNVEHFVQEGGGLIIFAGDQLDIDYYNTQLYRGGDGVLPAALHGFEQPPPGTGSMTFASWDADHPMMRAFVNELAGILRQVRIHAYIAVDPASIGTHEQPDDGSPSTSVETESTALPSSNDMEKRDGPIAAPALRRAPARVIARFSNADHSPAIVQRRFGRGWCVFIATSADQEWNDWAANFSYLPMMLELVQHIAKPATAAGQSIVDSPIVCPLNPSSFKTTARLRTPGYPLEPELTLKTAPSEGPSSADKSPILTYDATTNVGIYQFRLSATTGETLTRYAAVNPDSAESNLATVGRLELDSELSEDMPFEYLADIGALAEQSAHSKQEIWWQVLLAAITVLMMEHALAWWFGTRGL